MAEETYACELKKWPSAHESVHILGRDTNRDIRRRESEEKFMDCSMPVTQVKETHKTLNCSIRAITESGNDFLSHKQFPSKHRELTKIEV